MKDEVGPLLQFRKVPRLYSCAFLRGSARGNHKQNEKRLY